MRLTFLHCNDYTAQLQQDLSKINPFLSEQQWQSLCQQGQLYCATFNQRHVAYCIVEHQQQSLHITQLQVREITQRRGIGVFMFQQLLALAVQQSCDSLFFPAATASSGQAFYQHLGIEAERPFKVR